MEGIGNTPLIKLNHLTTSGSADVYVKYEGANPTGSMKDRMARSMIEGAERRNEVQRGYTVIEYTGGSTGSSLAMICARKGYNAHFVSSDAFSEEKIQTMRAFGANVELISSEDGKISVQLINSMKQRIEELKMESNTFWIDQFNNVDNRNGYHSMAREIIESLDSNIDEFIAGIGTGGCFSGNAEVLKKHIPNVKCIATEPYFVRALSNGNKSGTHRLEGMGIGFVTSITRLDLADQIIPIKDEDAFKTTRALAQKEGIFGGISSGSNVWAAIKRAEKIGPGKTIVTVICDTGLKYLNEGIFN